MSSMAEDSSDRLPAASEALPAYFDEMLRDSTVARDPTPLCAQPEIREPAAAATPSPLPQDASGAAGQSGRETVQGLVVQVFSVAGLKLALPAEKVGSIVGSPSLTASSADAAPWVMGTFSVADGIATVVNPCSFILPPERRPPVWRPGAVIMLCGTCWGLGCDEHLATVCLEPGEVRWRTSQTRRPWLTGTVSGLGYALLDGDALTALFDHEIKSWHHAGTDPAT